MIALTRYIICFFSVLFMFGCASIPDGSISMEDERFDAENIKGLLLEKYDTEFVTVENSDGVDKIFVIVFDGSGLKLNDEHGDSTLLEAEDESFGHKHIILKKQLLVRKAKKFIESESLIFGYGDENGRLELFNASLVETDDGFIVNFKQNFLPGILEKSYTWLAGVRFSSKGKIVSASLDWSPEIQKQLLLSFELFRKKGLSKEEAFKAVVMFVNNAGLESMTSDDFNAAFKETFSVFEREYSFKKTDLFFNQQKKRFIYSVIYYEQAYLVDSLSGEVMYQPTWRCSGDENIKC